MLDSSSFDTGSFDAGSFDFGDAGAGLRILSIGPLRFGSTDVSITYSEAYEAAAIVLVQGGLIFPQSNIQTVSATQQTFDIERVNGDGKALRPGVPVTVRTST